MTNPTELIPGGDPYIETAYNKVADSTIDAYADSEIEAVPVTPENERIQDACMAYLEDREDPHRFEAAVVEILPMVHRICRARLYQREDAEEAASMAMVEIVKTLSTSSIDKLRSRSVVGLLVTIAIRRGPIDFLRASQRTAKHHKLVSELPWDITTGEDAASRLMDGAEREESITALEGLLKTLSPHQRQVLVMREIDDMRAKEVGAVLQTSEGAVRVAHHRALVKIRQRAAGVEHIRARHKA